MRARADRMHRRRADRTHRQRPTLPLIVLSLLTVAGTHRKNRPNNFYTGVVGDLDFLGMGFFASPTGRTMFSRVNTFKGGVIPQTDIFYYFSYHAGGVEISKDKGRRHPFGPHHVCSVRIFSNFFLTLGTAQ